MSNRKTSGKNRCGAAESGFDLMRKIKICIKSFTIRAF